MDDALIYEPIKRVQSIQSFMLITEVIFKML